jgi:hypothetical protein
MLRKRSLIAFILILAQDSSTLLVSTGGNDLDPCAGDVSLAFAIEAVSEALRMTGIGEDLDASIEDFDPCLPNDKILEEDISDLLKKLAQAIILGVPGTYGPGESRYDAVMSKVWRAAQGLNPEAAMSLPEPKNPPPECEASYEFEIDIHAFCPEIVEECYDPSCVKQGTFRYGAEMQIAGWIPLTITTDAGTSQV